jgi:hypothetical protein
MGSRYGSIKEAAEKCFDEGLGWTGRANFNA